MQRNYYTNHNLRRINYNYNGNNHYGRQAEEETKPDIGSLIKIQDKVGPRYHDTTKFDDLQELEYKPNSPFEWQLIRIRLWYGNYIPTTVVNGIQLVFRNVDNGRIYETTARFGDHQLIGYQNFDIANGEVIEKVEVRVGEVMDQLILHTNKGRTISKGGEGSSAKNWCRKLFETWDFKENGNIVIGTFGGFGGHIHNIGFYLADRKDVRYWKRRSYVLMRASLEKDKDYQENIVKTIRKYSKSKEAHPTIALMYLITMGDQIFAQVMRYV